MRNTYKVLVEKTEGKRPFGRPRRRWAYDIRRGFRDIGWEVVDWIHLGQDRDQWQALVKTVMNFGFHKRWGIC
jgi:hypothetical protein